MTAPANNISSFSNIRLVFPNKSDSWKKVALKITLLVISFPIALLKDLFNMFSKSNYKPVSQPDTKSSPDKKVSLNFGISNILNKSVSFISNTLNHSVAFITHSLALGYFNVILLSSSWILSLGYCSPDNLDRKDICKSLLDINIAMSVALVLAVIPSVIHQISKQIVDYKNDKAPSIKESIFRSIKWIVYPAITGATIGLASFPIRKLGHLVESFNFRDFYNW